MITQKLKEEDDADNIPETIPQSEAHSESVYSKFSANTSMISINYEEEDPMIDSKKLSIDVNKGSKNSGFSFIFSK